MEINIAEQVVALTKTEFNILLYLAKRPQVVISRTQMIHKVLGYDFEGYDRVIDAHIKNIRHKIEQDPQKPMYIATIYGAGYKFIGQRDP
jgi:DNA-binding response OmpR family regulator